MVPEQLALSFTAAASTAAGEIWASKIEPALKLTLKTPGWNGRTAPPQFVDLGCGCELVVIPAYLWRARVQANYRGRRHDVIALPRAS
ncbi:hypothetical protein FHW12_003134 [Dokdonella fugitiva]|uniref:Uncharacterized protein n=1 Tax=Dokdonella fugitiva TaxID=328517 RepID=A0A839F5S6_9GAMM|nr:hypothetical protein [Dokdonella fugitiva]MBA8888898.1 hypothetical protein [Dokdonella fugitiva]